MNTSSRIEMPCLCYIAYYTCIVFIYLEVQAASFAPASPQLNTYNAPTGPELVLEQQIIASAKLDNDSAASLKTAVDFERSNWATGSVFKDAFYQVPANASLNAGALLKIEEATNVRQYTIPPKLALSRYLYNTRNFNGSVVPNSAFVLWPWQPKLTQINKDGRIPVILWAHGTSGLNPECAPSHAQNLWYQFHALFTLALQGYAVVAPDFAGLGVSHTVNGTAIPHQWVANPAAANDLAYAFQAARTAWPTRLTDQFVVMGHSQGGGAAWAFAQRQASRPQRGYLGTVAASPVTELIQYANNLPSSPPFKFAFSAIPAAMESIYPGFSIDDWLTAEGVQKLNLYKALNGCQSTALEIYSDAGNLLKPGFAYNPYFRAFASEASNGRKPIDGPMLVLQGSADPIVDGNITNIAVYQTCNLFPTSSIQYETFDDTSHVPALYSGQQIWTRWIEDRFNGIDIDSMCNIHGNKPVLPPDRYQHEVNSFIEYPLHPYELA